MGSSWAPAVVAAAVFAAARLQGHNLDWFPFPTITPPTPDLLPALTCLLLAIPALPWPSRGSSG